MKHLLDLKIPPPVIMLLLALLTWLMKIITPDLVITFRFHSILAGLFALLGLSLEISGIFSTLRARTTVDPTHPQNASRLVTTGIFSFTRNPIYLGDVLFLIGWSAYLSYPLGLLCPLLFILYIDRFQIKPEETAMLDLFGSRYLEYKKRVGHWL